LTITVSFYERNLSSGEKIRPVGRILKRWTDHVRMISQSNLRTLDSGPLRCSKKLLIIYGLKYLTIVIEANMDNCGNIFFHDQ